MRNVPILAVLLLVLPHPGAAQRSFSDSSQLANPSYVRDRIHEITDADLWGSLDLGRPGLERVRVAAGDGNSGGAAEAWGAYWRGKNSPSYITQTDHLFLDTDLLTDTAQFRAALEKLP